MKNEVLFQRIKKLVSLERRIGIEVLECLYEIDLRRAYAELKYDGLYTYCIKELGFSDSQAYQRIQAMRALKEIPELKPLIESGSLSVSSVSKVQAHLRQERRSGIKRTITEKKDLFESMNHCTSRQVDSKLAEVRGEKLKRKIVLELDEELETLWMRVKNLAAHKSKDQDQEVLRILATEWLRRNDPLDKAKIEKNKKEKIEKPKTELKPKLQTETETVPNKSPITQADSKPTSAQAQLTVPLTTWLSPKPRPTPQTRRISTKLKHQIWIRDQAQCTRCYSQYALQIDHRFPFALGGQNTADNLRLLCRSCNQFAAVQIFGTSKHLSIKDKPVLTHPSVTRFRR